MAKKIDRVFRAVCMGDRTTSVEVSAITGLSVRMCSAYLGQLVNNGILKRVERRKFPHAKGLVTVYQRRG